MNIKHYKKVTKIKLASVISGECINSPGMGLLYLSESNISVKANAKVKRPSSNILKCS